MFCLAKIVPKSQLELGTLKNLWRHFRLWSFKATGLVDLLNPTVHVDWVIGDGRTDKVKIAYVPGCT